LTLIFVHPATFLYGKYYIRLEGKRLESVTRNGDYVMKDFALTTEEYYSFFYRGTSRGHQQVLQNDSASFPMCKMLTAIKATRAITDSFG
jgi:hypothetical protein